MKFVERKKERGAKVKYADQRRLGPDLAFRQQGLCPFHGQPLDDHPIMGVRTAPCCSHDRPYGDPVAMWEEIEPDEFDKQKRKDGNWPRPILINEDLRD